MESNHCQGVVCSECGAGCPFKCMETHIALFACHNAECPLHQGPIQVDTHHGIIYAWPDAPCPDDDTNVDCKREKEKSNGHSFRSRHRDKTQGDYYASDTGRAGSSSKGDRFDGGFFDGDGFASGPLFDMESLKERMTRGSDFDPTRVDRIKRYYCANRPRSTGDRSRPKSRSGRAPSQHRHRASQPSHRRDAHY